MKLLDLDKAKRLASERASLLNERACFVGRGSYWLEYFVEREDGSKYRDGSLVADKETKPIFHRDLEAVIAAYFDGRISEIDDELRDLGVEP